MQQNYFDFRVLLEEKEYPKYHCFSCHNVQNERALGWMQISFIMDDGKKKTEITEYFCSFRCFLIWLEENRDVGTCKKFDVTIF